MMKRLLLVFKMLVRAVSRMRGGLAPFTNSELVAGLSQGEMTRFPELGRFPDLISAEEAWRKAADETKGLWLTFTLLMCGMLILWRILGDLIRAWLKNRIVLGTFSDLCLHILLGGIMGVICIILAMRLKQSSVRRSLRRQLNGLGEPTCLSCGYDLTGNESGRCPECGYSTAQV